MQAILKRIDSYSNLLAPLAAKAKQYLKYPSSLGADGVIQIGHRPWVAELNYMLTLYPGIGAQSVEGYCKRFRIEVPGVYVDFLREVNGAFCFGMSLCGIPQSMLQDPPLLDRSILQCHDLGTAATQWIREYKVPSKLFHFGGRHYSFTENVGYFITEGGRFQCYRKNGKVVAEWANVCDFLADELEASEKLEEELNPSKW